MLISDVGGNKPKSDIRLENAERASIAIIKGEYPLKSVSVNNSFIEALSQKLLWGVDKRNMLK